MKQQQNSTINDNTLNINSLTLNTMETTNYLQQAKQETAENETANMLQAIETLKTASTFINSVNGHTAEDLTELINHINRYIKARLQCTTTVLNDGNDSDIDLYRSAYKNEAMRLIHQLSQ